MNKDEYKSFVRAMKVSYNIELKSTNLKVLEKKKKQVLLQALHQTGNCLKYVIILEKIIEI